LQRTRYIKIHRILERAGFGVSKRQANIIEHIGKVERFHQNLKYEALYPSFPRSLTEVRIICDRYRWYHNFQRPHWSQKLRTPAEMYLEKEWAEVRRLGLEKLKGLDRIEKLSEVI
jgi:transposase InsO family protein